MNIEQSEIMGMNQFYKPSGPIKVAVGPAPSNLLAKKARKESKEDVVG